VRAALAAKLPPGLLGRVTPLLGAHSRRGPAGAILDDVEAR
jgi:hypothetical protein